MAMHVIDLDGAEQNIFRNCVDELRMGGKPDKLKKVGHSTVYRTYESEEDEEEAEGTVLGDGGQDISIVPVVYSRRTVSVSSLGSFSFVGSPSKPSHPSLTVSFGASQIQEYFKNTRGRKRKFIKPQQEKARHEERMKRSKVIVRENLVVGYWDLIPTESIKTHDQKLSHNAKILIIVVIIFYPRTKNNEYIELSQFETETISSKDKSCDF